MAKVSTPISTISYNSDKFLLEVLETQLKLKRISYFEYITHLPDKDDKKSHKHLYIIPNKLTDLAVFSDYFLEPVDNNKPLKCMPFRKSKFGDWYWYALHNKEYLKTKLLERNKYYDDKDIVSSDYDFHAQLVQEVPLIEYAKFSDIGLKDYIFQEFSKGSTLQQILVSGNVPIGKVSSVISLYNALNDFNTNKHYNDRQTKENIENDIKYANQLKNNLRSNGFNGADICFDDPIF